MSYQIAPVDIWVTSVRNRAGELASLLAELQKAGAELEFIIGRPEDAGASAVFVAPLIRPSERAVAEQLGMHRSQHMHALRVAGPDQRGLGAQVTQILAEAKLNLRGITAAAIEHRSVIYLRFDSAADAERGAEALKAALR
jgi:predicted amino acid-binding ACT domain protein